jgi:hypothetical protein
LHSLHALVRFTEIQGFQNSSWPRRKCRDRTFIEKALNTSCRANDLCPVGALNNKPYRQRAPGK